MKKSIIVLIIITVAAAVFIMSGDKKTQSDKAVLDSAEIDKLEKVFKEYDKEDTDSYGYHYYSWDLNDDGQNEALRCYSEGSGLIYFTVECYEPTSEIFSALGRGDLRDYTLYIYEDNLYIISTESLISSRFDVPHAYKPVLIDNMIAYNELDIKLEEAILDAYEKEHKLPLSAQFMQ